MSAAGAPILEAEACAVLRNEPATADGAVRALAFDSARIAAGALPGQFLHVLCGARAPQEAYALGGVAPYLRRPFGVCDADAQSGAVTFLYRVQGEGTRWLAALQPGDALSVLGPLGNGFSWPAVVKSAAVLGGGIGVFPLLRLAKALRALAPAPPAVDVYLGFRDAASAVLVESFRAAATNIALVSDDGSLGAKALVTEPFRAALDSGKTYDIAFACGPAPMLRAVRDLCRAAGVPAQLSLEQRMGCGVGACLVCACAIKAEDAAGSGIKYARVCRDGPVFPASEVLFDGE